MRPFTGSRSVCLALLTGAGLLFARPGKDVEPEKIAALVEQLGDDTFARREIASKSLEAIGEPALSALVEAAAVGRDPEVRRRHNGSSSPSCQGVREQIDRPRKW